MDARYIMDYTAFELMYEGIRHTDVEERAKEWQLTAEQVETLKKRLLEEENWVYKYWLNNLPHFAVFEPDDEEDDEELHLFYDWDASDDNRLGADALTTIARDLIERVGHATRMVTEGVFPALADYADELTILIRDFNERAYDYDKVKRVETGAEDAVEDSLFYAGWRPSLSEANGLFEQFPSGFHELHDLMDGLRSEYIDWMEEKVAEMEDAIDDLDEDAPDYDEQREALADKCVSVIASDMVFNAGMGGPQYLYEVEDYGDALSTEYGVDIYGEVLQALREQAGVDEE
jgi:hypothetical protein|nr:MAG TPA: hypothetical protein [Caudoviricetes sp.]